MEQEKQIKNAYIKSLRGRYRIVKPARDFREVNLGYAEEQQNTSAKAYFTYDRAELRAKVIESGIYSEREIQIIEREGCNKVVASSLTISPFSGYRYYITKRYSEKIIKGIKILMGAVAADSAEIIVSKNFPYIAEACRNYVIKSPNINMIEVSDSYPLGFENILFEKTAETMNGKGYFPGKEGVLITPVDDLLRVYIQVEEAENIRFKPITIITPDENIFVWAPKEITLAQLLKEANIQDTGFLVKGDPLWGNSILYPEKERVENIKRIFIFPELKITLQKCVGCGRCFEVCPAKLNYTHSMAVLDEGVGVIPFDKIKGCIGCGLCGCFCPGWKK
jgi:Na+-translocating ferredoxin:NAD+ oxidoreductase RnfC subunit